MLTSNALHIQPSAVKENISNFLKTQIEASETSGVVLGMSGGIDSSVVAALCTDALGPDRVLGLLLPSETTNPKDMEDAKSLGSTLQIEQEVVDIQPLVEAFMKTCPGFDPTNRIAGGNLQPRFRMTTLYYYANRLNRLVAGSGNRSELLVGYFTKYGDGGVDILPIGDLYKTQVRQLATFLKLPDPIIRKPPSAGLWSGQTDEGEMGIKYETLDLILHGLVDLKMNHKEIADALAIPIGTVDKVYRMIKNSEHKRWMPPIPRLRPV